MAYSGILERGADQGAEKSYKNQQPMKASYLIQAEYYLRRKNRFYFRDPDTKKKTISFELFGDDFDKTKKMLVRGKQYSLRSDAASCGAGYLKHSENGDVSYVSYDLDVTIDVIDM